MYYLQNFNSYLITQLKEYKITLIIFSLFTFIGFLSINYIEKQRLYYERKSEFRDSLITPEEAGEMKDEFDYIIDTRTPEEYKEGHVKNSINIPHQVILNDPKILFYKYKITKDDTLFIYCKSGNRASQVVRKLLDFDYKSENIYFSTKTYDVLQNYIN